MPQNQSVLIIGSGAREHTISHAYEKSPSVSKIIVAPGNDFIAFNRKKEVLIDKNCSLKDPQSILEIAKKYKPDLIDVAQDDALAAGTVDLLRNNNFQTFGPTKAAARIEWDKQWSRDFMQRHNIPTPHFKTFSDELSAKRYAQEQYAKDPKMLLYIKATGLCAGKGAIKASTLHEAYAAIEKMKSFGDAGKTFLIEQGLKGEEFSYYAISDGQSYKLFKSAQDHKTIFNFDEGNQTGGMGTVSPVNITKGRENEIEQELISKALQGMQHESLPYQGILYLGGMVVNNKPFNIEYNARWGDPECQVVLPGIETDYFELVSACIQQRLNSISLSQDNKTRACVIGASRGYPDDYSSVKGKRIFGIEEAIQLPGVTIFGAGIEVKGNICYAYGGRILSVVGEGSTLREARKRAYEAISLIHVEGNNLHYRTDIGWRDIERELNSKNA